MRVIIAGSRNITDYTIVWDAIDASPFDITTVISGGARGVDRIGEMWALKQCIPIEYFDVFDEDWRQIGPRAGHLRNAGMAAYGEALILVWTGHSPGSRNMLHAAKTRGLPVHERIVAV